MTNCIVDKHELDLCQYALEQLIKEYPNCDPNFEALNDKLVRLGFGYNTSSNKGSATHG